MAVAADAGGRRGRGRGFDLAECVREPIHLLGGVQSCGSLVAVDPETGVIEVAARNTGALLGVEAVDLVGGPVTRLVPAEAFEEAVRAAGEEGGVPAALDLPDGATAPDRGLDVSAHRRDGLLIMEFEPRGAADAGARGFYQGCAGRWPGCGPPGTWRTAAGWRSARCGR